MSCSNLTGGFTLDCADAQGGVDKVFIANGPIQSFTETAGNVTDIQVGGSSITPADFFTFEMPRATGNLVETVTVSQENGTVTYDQQVTMIFNRMEAEKRNQLLLMMEATSMIVVVKDNNGTYWLIGAERNTYAVSSTNTTNVGYADRNGYEVVLGAMEPKPMFTVTSTLVEA